jgi:hypothetical protein
MVSGQWLLVIRTMVASDQRSVASNQWAVIRGQRSVVGGQIC